MLDENLPTFVNKPSSDNPNLRVLYLAQNGDEPRPEYILKRPDPSLSASRNKYAVGLTDSFAQDVVYAEVLIEPEWTQPSLSAAELRAQNGVPPPPVPILPDSFIVQLYNPDQQVTVKQIPGSWNSRESWEFEMPEQSFRVPSASRIDREQDDPVASELTPKIMFRWKREGRLSKDMTCYMTGKSLGGNKSKEPDITVALYKQRRGGETSVTVYEPNMQRVEVEDRKGLDIVLLLGAEVIKDLYLSPRTDPFNIASGPGATGAAPVASKRKNSRPSAVATPANLSGPAAGGAAMPGTLSNVQPSKQKPKPYTTANNIASSSSSPPPAGAAVNQRPPPTDPRTQWEIDAETKRLQALVEKEEREREKREKAEQKRIKKMLEDEEKERRRREAEVAKETERLKKLYGVEGQDFSPTGPPPQLPPRRPAQGPVPVMSGASLGPVPWVGGAVPPPPPRPVSAGPPATMGGGGGLFQNCSWLGALTGQGRGSGGYGNSQPSGGGPYIHLPGANSTMNVGLSGSGGRDRRKMQKKRSVHF